MNKFFETWKSYKDKLLVETKLGVIQEFTTKDRQELIGSGDDFTVSYEIEMVSKDAIDDDGNILTSSGRYGGTRLTDINDFSSAEQVDFLGLEDSIQESVESREPDDFYASMIDDKRGSADNIRQDVIAVMAAYYAYDLYGDKNNDYITISDAFADAFVIASFLTQNDDVYGSLINAGDDQELRNQIIEKITEYGNSSESRSIRKFIDEYIENLNEARGKELFSTRLAEMFGFDVEGEDWTLHTSFLQDLPYNIRLRDLFKHIVPAFDFEAEVGKLNAALKFLTGNTTSPDLSDLSSLTNRRQLTARVVSSGRFETRPSSYSVVADFDEFNTGIKELSDRVGKYIQDQYENQVENFNYSDWVDNLEDYGAYDSSEGRPRGNPTGENALEKYLPNFWDKYGDQMDTLPDSSLPAMHNIEIKMKTYIKGLNNAIQYLEDFFTDFDNQNNFSFTKDTGLHTNISMEIPDKKFNLIKALLFLSEEETTPGKVPYAYKGTESRFTDREWSKPLKNQAFHNVKMELKKMYPKSRKRLLDIYANNDFNFLSDYFSEIVKNYASSLYVKGYGFNTQYTESRGYIEFRYPGHELKKEALQNLTMYYAYIIKLSLDPNFKREEYISKFVKFLQDVFASKEDTSTKNMKEFIETYKIVAPALKNLLSMYSPDDMRRRVANHVVYYQRYFFEELIDQYLPRPTARKITPEEYFALAKKVHGPLELLDQDPGLKDEVINLYKNYNKIPVYYYATKLLESVKDSDSKAFFGTMTVIPDLLNALYYDDAVYKRSPEFSNMVFGRDRNVISNITETIKDLFNNRFIVYYERHIDEFASADTEGNITPPGQQQVQENIFNKYEKAFEDLYERKLGKPSSETNLGDWFKRKGAPGKKGGWVDCNTCRDGKCKPCGRQSGEKRSKYPRCRPTPSQCKGYKRRGDNLQKEEE